jgi:PqqD family protein of HPr-rel-A system
LDTTSLRDLAISDTGFVFDPYTGHTFTVNATGLLLLKELAHGAEAAALAGVLAERFECTDDDDPGRDVAEFLGMLKDAGLVR